MAKLRKPVLLKSRTKKDVSFIVRRRLLAVLRNLRLSFLVPILQVLRIKKLLLEDKPEKFNSGQVLAVLQKLGLPTSVLPVALPRNLRTVTIQRLRSLRSLTPIPFWLVNGPQKRPGHAICAISRCMIILTCVLWLDAEPIIYIYSRRPHEKELVSKMREYSEPVEASADIPLGQRDWCCPFCPKALPSLAKALKEKSVKHHYRTYHPRRKITAGRLNAIRWKLAKKDPSKVVNYLQGKRSLSKKLKQRAIDRKDFKNKGHDIVSVRVNWTNWPRHKKYAYRKGDSLYTCRNCRRWRIGKYRF